MNSKIDKNLFNIVQSLNHAEQKVDCLIYARNYGFAKRYLKKYGYDTIK